jgi:hypothetical protein
MFTVTGLGSVLLVSALRLILTIRTTLGIAIVVVHAPYDDPAKFYEHQGFTRFRDEPNHHYMPLATFETVLGES